MKVIIGALILSLFACRLAFAGDISVPVPLMGASGPVGIGLAIVGYIAYI